MRSIRFLSPSCILRSLLRAASLDLGHRINSSQLSSSSGLSHNVRRVEAKDKEAIGTRERGIHRTVGTLANILCGSSTVSAGSGFVMVVTDVVLETED